MARRSIGLPLTLGITLSVVTAALAVGWQILVVGDLGPVTRGLTGLHWAFIILGSVFFVLLIVGLVLLCAWLVREMRHNQRQQAFLDAVTHELKTPLASLRLYLETLERRDPDEARRRAFLARMGEDVARLDRTVGKVLAAARADAPRLAEPAESVDVADLLRSCVEDLRVRHGLAPEAIRLEAPTPEAGSLLAVRAVPEELGLVFRNLIENAVKYSEPPVEVRVSASRDADGRVRVEIADRGIGIERRELRKIFQRFYRVRRDVQRQVAGLGLGLFIVRSLVRRQGGRVEARSEGSGQGSRFCVVLPAAGTAPAASAPSAGAAPVREGA